MLEMILAVATILGGLSAIWYFFEKFRFRRTARSIPSVDMAISVKSGPSLPGVPSEPETSSPGARGIPVTEFSGAEAALPLSSVLQALSDPRTTPLQRSQFVDRHRGRFVVWTGIVHTVKKMWEHQIDSDLLIVMAPTSGGRESASALATAIFPKTEADILGQVHEGDKIVVEGALTFHELAGNWSAGLVNSRFIRKESRPERQGA